jgi:parallel beta helix pectate lyase-like protein
LSFSCYPGVSNISQVLYRQPYTFVKVSMKTYIGMSSKFLTFSLFLVFFLISIPISSSGLDDATDNVIFNGSDSFDSSSYVRSGDGTQGDPFIISDIAMGPYTLSILNSVEYVVIKNITFNSGSGWAIALTSTNNVLIYNVTTNGKGQLIYASSCQNIIILDCNFSNVKSATDSCRFDNVVDLSIQDSIFDYDDITGAGRIFFNNQGSGHTFLRNYCEGVAYVDERFLGSGQLINNTFINSPVSIKAGNTDGQIIDNIFDTSTGDALTIISGYRLKISGNFFRGDNGIYFQAIPYSWDTEPGWIDNNTFESCGVGIGTANNWQTRLSRYNVLYNYFGNCTGYAVNLNYGNNNYFWRNSFYHNAGTDNSTAGAQATMVNWGGAQYANLWTMGTLGNFWANHRRPDADNNGITDVNYTIPQGGIDSRPSTNPYFDITPPTVVVTDPPTGTYPRSYIRVQWEASDVGSGLETVEISIDGGPYEEITGKDHHSIFLPKGVHDIDIRAYDKAGLIDENGVQVTIVDTESVLGLDHPLNGAYYSNTTHRLAWTVQPYFDTVNMTLTLDGAPSYLPTNARLLTKEFSEGIHSVKVKIIDDDGMSFEKTSEFTVDLTPPDLIVRSPLSGSVISNSYVTFNYSATDNFGIDKVEVRYDNEPYVDRTESFEFSDFLSVGGHLFNIRVIDLAGTETNLTIPFTVGGDPGISILEPLNGSVTKESIIQFVWEYSGPFPWIQSSLRVGKGLFEDKGGAKEIDINLLSDGEYELTLRLEDIFGNYIEKSSTVIKDTRPPIVDFIYPKDGQVVNEEDIEIQWIGTDNIPLPIAEYQLKIDSGSWIDVSGSSFRNETLDPGEHSLMIKAIDTAGNVDERVITFHIDTTPPILRIISPGKNAFLKDSLTTIEWEASDDLELNNLTLIIDHRSHIDVLGRSTYSTTIGTDGPHTISLIGVDTAGNLVNNTITIFVDLLPPQLSWIKEPKGTVGWYYVNISWEASDEFGIMNLTLYVNDDPIYLPVNSTYINLTLDEGTYRFSLVAKDFVEWIFEILSTEDFVIDTTPPELSIDLDQSNVLGGKASIYWLSSDGGSGIALTEIDIDGEGYAIITIGQLYVFEELEQGEHRITIRVKDNSGNYQEAYWDIEIKKENGSGGGDDGGGIPTMGWIAMILVGALVLLMVIGIIISKKRSKPEEKKAVVKKPDRIDMGLPATAAHSALGERPTNMDLPPASEHKVETREDGSGYIRPKSDKKKEKKIIEMRDEPADEIISNDGPGIPDASEELEETYLAPTPPTPEEEVAEEMFTDRSQEMPLVDLPEEED